jgi:5'-3' exonuclease
VTRPFDPAVIVEYLEKLQSQQISITSDDMALLKDMFRVLQVPSILAHGEGEALASALCVNGLVDLVASEDTDVLAYGAPLVISKINTSAETCIELRHADLLEKMELSHEQFRDLCIMCGTDYNRNMPGVGPDTSFKLIYSHGSIEEIAKLPKYDVSILKYDRVRELFGVENCVFVLASLPQGESVKIVKEHEQGVKKYMAVPYCGKPSESAVQQWCWRNNVRIHVGNLVSSFSRKELMFEE